MKWQAEAFWQFSCHFYPPRKTTFIYLQDHYQLNVNLLLLALFLDQHNSYIGQANWINLIEAISESELQINQFRHRRRTAKTQQSPDYNMLLQRELELEKAQQQLIIRQLNQFSLDIQSTVNNLHQYCLATGVKDMFSITEALDKLAS
ncbi:DUF2390 domain-containing protein [Neptunicella sp. SCSIO 80796]|uniref:DUF2390 domain-containing protein n=1 Tax=Neptunicella plasticusilytica TaxID=3117012 RepID=UPI003A4DDF5E